MNKIKTEFTIKDLENFSGIKAHTIRIWEKRYNLLSPQRTFSNIRYYDIDNLMKLLNITQLYNNGVKISKIAKLSENEIIAKVRETAIIDGLESDALNSFKIAMLNFDENLFNSTYNNLTNSLSFREIFINVFIPFLTNVGVLWHTKSITPAHEHFIANLIKQKLLINIEKVNKAVTNNQSEVYVLFLPDGEIHDLGLLYIHLELLLHGKHSIFLGSSVPIDCLKDVQHVFSKITFITNLTVEPQAETIDEYLSKFKNELLSSTQDAIFVLGNKVNEVENEEHLNFDRIKLLKNIKELLNFI